MQINILVQKKVYTDNIPVQPIVKVDENTCQNTESTTKESKCESDESACKSCGFDACFVE
jgi:hypothetical protein